MADWNPDANETRKPTSVFSLVYVLLSGAIAGLSWLASWTETREEGTFNRDIYANKEDCLKDWGQEDKCEQQTNRGGTVHGSYYYGPSYRPGEYGTSPESRGSDKVDPARAGSHSLGVAHVSRGGFGASGAAHAAHGS